MPSYIQRSLEPVLLRAAREFPAVMLTGPRQSGKTTLLKRLLSADHGYVSLEAPDITAAAQTDPRGFLAAYPPPIIFDEVQHAPDLLPYIKESIDAHRDRPGQFILTGSQNLLLAERISESLAGRAAILKLLPLSWREIRGDPQAPLAWEGGAQRPAGAIPRHELWAGLVRGCYPELVAGPGRDAALWQSSYVQTYIERDVRAVRQIGDLGSFQSFLQALAARSGQLLNLAEVSRDLGTALNTLRAWLSVLEATYQVIVLRPYFANIGKRSVKTPKVYLSDPGTLCYLAGLKDPEHAAAGPLGGAIFETAVLMEIVKTLLHRGQEPRIYFWRTSRGAEVDILVAVNGQLVPVEVKLSATPRPAMASSIQELRADLGEVVTEGYVVHPGDTALPLGPGVTAIPFAHL